MKLVDEFLCPVSGEPGNVVIPSVRDAFFGTDGDWRYRRNPRTGHLWLDPRPADEDIGELYRTYYTHQDPPSGAPSLWEQAQAFVQARRLGYPMPANTSTAARIIAMMPSVADAAIMEPMRIPASQSGHVLDVGCGSGAFLKRMRDAGWQTSGMEPDPNAALRVRQLLGAPVFGSIEEIEAGDQRYDLITLSHVIEHVPDPIAILRRLASLLAPGGHLVITTPNSKSLGARLFGSHWRGLEPPRHFNVFSPKSLAEAMERAQLSVEVMTTHSRLARGIFYLSVLARRGYRELESRRPGQSRPLTLAGYMFQVAESLALRIFPSVGEEIYCRACVAKTSAIEST
jgi:SAM-dependent methyltransferase